MERCTILRGDCREALEALAPGCVQCCVTSPPYWGLRSYLPDDHPDKAKEVGTEETPELYVEHLLEAFRAVHRVLADDGVLWLNLGDSYANDTKRKTGLKSKDLVGIPWLVAVALRSDGWYLRADVIWSKPNGMPESVTDRPTVTHEYLFLLTKSAHYFYDAAAIREPSQYIDRAKDTPGTRSSQASSAVNNRRDSSGGVGFHPDGRNKRSVWSVNTHAFPGAHFAVMPPKLVEPCVLAGSRQGDLVLDPFAGAGTTAVIALQHARRFIGCDLHPDYVELAEDRVAREAGQGMLFTPTGDLPTTGEP